MKTKIERIESGELDTDDLREEFNEYLYDLGYEPEVVWEYTDEHYENLLSPSENKRKFIVWLNERSK